ncbi:FadR/GntR family transcriptional regulator [Nocardiopsis oceani]
MASSIQFSPAVGVRTFERIVDQVESALLSGRLVPGDHLPSERMLMDQFDVSRSTVREALRVLESRGLLELRPGGRSGPRILRPTAKLLERDLTQMVRLGGSGFGDLLQMRMGLEGTACAIAAQRATDEDVTALRERLADMERAAEDGGESFARADAALHQRIWSITGNQLLITTGQAISESIVRLIAADLLEEDAADSGVGTDDGGDTDGGDTDGAWDSLRRDRMLVDLIEYGDAAAAGSWIRRSLSERFARHLSPEEARVLESLVS